LDRKIFHRLISVDEVFDVVEKYYPLKPLGIERVSIEDALNRVLAQDVYAPIDHPPFDRSMVDGYAVRSDDIVGADELNPVKLVVKGKIEPGQKPGINVDRGEAVEIATGAMIPRGVDSVVMVEYTRIEDSNVYIYRSTVPGENISTTGSDISSGDLVVLKGTIIDENLVGVLSGLGIKYVNVYVKPRIAVYSIGDEVVEPGKPLEDGKVYDVNGYLVTSGLKKIGLDPDFKGVLPDNYDILYRELEKDLREYDIIITSGGTSAGLGDVVYRVFNDLGEPGIIVHGLKIKPGKPTVIAIVNNKLLIGLPGFPLSCYMVFNLIVKPMIGRIIGLTNNDSEKIKAKVPYRIKKQLGKTWLIPVTLIESRKGYTAYPVSLESGSISPFIYSDGYMILPENRDVILENSLVEVQLFRRLEDLPKLNIIGSNDYLLYEILVESNLAYLTRILSIGSSGGWEAIKREEADIAPTHLLDEETLVYNKPFLEKYGLSDKAVLIRGYGRLIGIIVEKNNPKNIRDVRDFLREDIVIVNRTKGSGTRVYLDYLLKRIALEEGIDFNKLISRINGYYYEVKTHTAVASAIKHGRADAGIGLGIVAKIYDLNFIPLTWEEYDFLILHERLEKEHVRIFIERLRDHDFMNNLIGKYKGYYKLYNDTGYPI